MAKNLSSFSPRRSRKTPRNQKKAMPAKGKRLRASDTFPDPSLSQSPVSRGSTGSARQSNDRLQMNSSEKTIPAMAAARGVLSLE